MSLIIKTVLGDQSLHLEQSQNCEMPEPCVCHIFIFILRSSDSALQRQTFFLSQNSRFNFGCIVFFVFFSHGTNFLWKTAPKQQRNTQSASWNHGTQDHYVIRAYGIPESSSHRPQMLFSLSEFRSPVFLIWSLCVALHLCSVFVWCQETIWERSCSECVRLT